MNGNGPTSAADPWTALGDIAGVIAPAIMGAQIGQGEGGGGAAMGALDAVGRTVDRRREMAKEDADTKYRQALMQEADIRAQELEMILAEKKKALANVDDYLAGLPPEERKIAALNPEAHINRKIKALEVPKLASTMSKIPGVQVPEETLASMPYEVLIDWFKKTGPLSGGQTEVKPIQGPSGEQGLILNGMDQSGKPFHDVHWTPAPRVGDVIVKREYDRKTQTFEDVGTDRATGKEAWRKPAGEDKLTAQERDALRFEKVAIQQAGQLKQSLQNLIDKPGGTSAFKSWWEGVKYQDMPKLAGILGDISGGKVGGFDPDYVSLFTNMGQLEAMLQRAYTGGRVAAPIYMRLVGHIPHVGEPDALVMDKLKSLISDKGAMKEMIGVIESEEKNRPLGETVKSPTGGASGSWGEGQKVGRFTVFTE